MNFINNLKEFVRSYERTNYKYWTTTQAEKKMRIKQTEMAKELGCVADIIFLILKVEEPIAA